MISPKRNEYFLLAIMLELLMILYQGTVFR